MGKKSSKQADERSQLPAAIDAERAILGAILLDNLSYHEAASRLRVEEFSLDSHRRIYLRMTELIKTSRPIDMITLIEELDRHKDLQAIGDVAYVSSLVEGVPDRPSIEHYVEIVREKALRRAAISAANTLIACAVDPGDPIKHTMSLTTEQLLRLQGDATVAEAEFVRTGTQEVLDDVSRLMYLEREVIGLSFGIKDLDEATTGLRDGEITTVGGYPGSAKSSLALGVCRIAAEKGIPAVFFSLEMTRAQLILRLFAQVSGISFSKLRDPRNLHSSERRELDAWVKKLDALPLLIDDQARDVAEIVPRAHLYIRQHKVGLIAIDYLQLMIAPGETKTERVSNASAAIWQLEKSTQVPILCLSQLSRPEGRTRGSNIPPNMHQLRDSGEIEQNTHNVLLLYRPYSDDGVPTGDDAIILAKQRSGILGRVKCWFNGSAQRWEDRSAETKAPQQNQMFKDSEVTS